MKHLKFKLFPTLLFFVATVFISCENENSQEENNLELTTNYERIKDNLKIYEEARSTEEPVSSLYFCSEQGGDYPYGTYVWHGIYLNEFYVPDNAHSNSNRYASWMNSLQSWLMNDFNDSNPSGSNSIGIDITFDVYGANGSTYLNATDGNRAYNEFVCQLMDELSISSVGDLDNYEFSLSITVDYTLCCIGTSCCDPELFASGTAYY